MSFLSRFRPHFSLRSLLLGTLVLGAAAALWRNFDPWRIEREFSNPDMGILVGFSPDGKWIHANTRSAGADFRPVSHQLKTILWEVDTGRFTQVLHEQHAETVVGTNVYSHSIFSEDSRKLLSVFRGVGWCSVKVWDIQSQTESPLPLTFFTTSPPQKFGAGHSLIVKSSDQTLHFIDTDKNALLASIPGITSHQLSASGQRVATLCEDGSIRIFATESGREIQRIPAPIDWEVIFVTHFTDRKMLVLGTLREHDWTSTSNDILRFDPQNPGQPELCPDNPSAISEDESLAVFDADTEFRIVDLRTSQVLASMPHSRSSALIFTNGNTRLFDHLDLSMYETATGRRVYKIENEGNGRPSHDHSRFLARTEGASGQVSLHDMKTGELLQTFNRELLSNDFDSFSPDDSSFVTQNRATGAIHIWTRHRPEHWWGLAWLPEFWLLLTFSVAFVWSLRRDWKSAAISTSLPLAGMGKLQ